VESVVIARIAKKVATIVLRAVVIVTLGATRVVAVPGAVPLVELAAITGLPSVTTSTPL
jgi:hypothetical protein